MVVDVRWKALVATGVGAVGSFAAVAWWIGPSATTAGWGLLAGVAAGWVITFGLVWAMAARPAVRESTVARSVLWVAVMAGAYGRGLISNCFVIADISSVSNGPSEARASILIIGEQGWAVLALCGVWVIVTGRLGDDCRPAVSQHYRVWPVWLRIVMLWMVFQVIGLVVSRIVLPGTRILPTGAGTFHGNTWTEWVRAALAGPYEELGFTGLTAVLVVLSVDGRPSSTRRVCVGVLLAGAMRALPHLYYGRGELTSSTVLPIPDHLAAALNQLVWCTIWAGGAMWLYLHYRRVWPLAAAHSAWNLSMMLLLAPFVLLVLIYLLMKRFLPNHRWTRAVKIAQADAERHLASQADRLKFLERQKRHRQVA